MEMELTIRDAALYGIGVGPLDGATARSSFPVL